MLWHVFQKSVSSGSIGFSSFFSALLQECNLLTFLSTEPTQIAQLPTRLLWLGGRALEARPGIGGQRFEIFEDL